MDSIEMSLSLLMCWCLGCCMCYLQLMMKMKTESESVVSLLSYRALRASVRSYMADASSSQSEDCVD